MNIWCSGYTFLTLEFQISTNSILWTHQNNGTFIDGNVKQISCCIHDGSERRRSFLHPYVRTWEPSAKNALVHSLFWASLWAAFHVDFFVCSSWDFGFEDSCSEKQMKEDMFIISVHCVVTWSRVARGRAWRVARGVWRVKHAWRAWRAWHMAHGTWFVARGTWHVALLPQACARK